MRLRMTMRGRLLVRLRRALTQNRDAVRGCGVKPLPPTAGSTQLVLGPSIYSRLSTTSWPGFSVTEEGVAMLAVCVTGPMYDAHRALALRVVFRDLGAGGDVEPEASLQ
jgi:hypothetical protein